MKSAPAPQVAVEELSDRAAIAALAPRWEELRAQVAAAGGVRGPFLGPTWFAVTAAAIARELVILVAHRGARVVGILPLFAERRRLAGLPARVLRSLSDDHSQRFDVLLAPDEPSAAGALFLRLRDRGGWDALELREIPEGRSGADELVAEARAAGHAVADWPAMRSPFLILDGNEPGDAKFRANLRRRKKKLAAELGAVTLERVESGDLDLALADGLDLEAAGWKGARGTAIACDVDLRRRYHQLAHAFAARSELALYFLRAGDRRVAFHFALIEDGVYYLFKPGFDPALARFGLGHLLVDEVIRDLAARGVRELDFLGDDMPWKRDWTDRVRAHSWRYVFARTSYGRALGAWKFSFAPTIKRLLGR
jgi:CelD/BcsL family acetyltransferase involved in cellulose biosynthesis